MNEFFKEIPVVKYEGRDSRNPLSGWGVTVRLYVPAATRKI